ncbi:hypothetical protein FRC07_002722, partial [Ceratobasidium sp. 392]
IEDTLYRVHKHRLMKSEIFLDMFKFANGDPDEGSSLENPIILQGVAASDFECLLKVLYEDHLTGQPELEASLVMPAFRLAHQWNFAELRAHLSPLAEKQFMSDIDRIVFAHKYDINEWLVPAYIRLCQRSGALSTDEAVKLGVHGVLLVYRLKVEYLRPKHLLCPDCLCSGVEFSSASSCGMCGRDRSDLKWPAKYYSENGTSLRPKIEKWIANGCVFKD